MKTIFKQSLLTVAVILWGMSCDSNDTPEDRIEINPATLTFEHEGGSLQFAVESNTSWTIDKSGCSWVTTNPSAGTGNQTVTVTAPENTQERRTGKLVLTAGDKSKELSITQNFVAEPTFATGDLSLSGSLTHTKSVGDNLLLLLPYENAQGGETFTLTVAVSGLAAPGITTDAAVDVTIANPGSGTVEIPVSGIPYKLGQVTFTVTGDAVGINKTLNATVTSDGKRYYNGAFVISGVMADPRGTDAPVAGAAATFANPDMGDERQHAGPYEYMQFLALEDIDFAQTPYCVIVCKNAPGSNGWVEGGANSTYKFNLTSGTASKGEFFYVGGTAKALSGYRDDAAGNGAWPNVPVGIMSMRDAKWIRTIAYNGNDFDDGTGLSTSSMFDNYTTAAGIWFDGIAAFRGTAVDKNSVPMDALFFGRNNDAAYNASAPGSYYTVPLNDLYNPADGYYRQGENAALLSVYHSEAVDHGEFMKFGGKLGIDGNNKIWLETRATTCISLGDPGMYIGSPSNATPEEYRYDPARESEANPHFPGDNRYTRRLATIADIETIGDGITAIVDQP